MVTACFISTWLWRTGCRLQEESSTASFPLPCSWATGLHPLLLGAQAVAGGRLPGSQHAQREWPSLGNESLFLSATSATLCVSFSSSLNFLLLKEALVDTAQSDLYMKWLRSSDEAEHTELPKLFLGTTVGAKPRHLRWSTDRPEVALNPQPTGQAPGTA